MKRNAIQEEENEQDDKEQENKEVEGIRRRKT